jgi:hypothetical protein
MYVPVQYILNSSITSPDILFIVIFLYIYLQDLTQKTVPPRDEESHLKMPNEIPREKKPNPIPVASARKQEVQTEQKVIWDESRELRAKQQVTRNYPKESRAEIEQPWARPRELRAESKDIQAEPKDIHVVPSRPERTDLYHSDYRLPDEAMPKKYKEKMRYGRERNSSYSVDEKKPGLTSVRSLSEKEQASNGLRSVSNIDRGVDDFVKPSKGKGINMAPPYIKPQSTRVDKHREEEECNGSDPYAAERPPIRPVKDEKVINMVPPYIKPGFEQHTKHGDHHGTPHGERPRPVSVRSKAPRPSVPNAKEEELFDEANMNHTPSMRRKHGHRPEIASRDDDNDVYARQRGREMLDDGVNGEMHEARHHLRRHKSQGSSANFDEDEEEEGDNAIDYGNLLRGTPRSHRRHKERQSSRHESERDDEERVMDKLLMHYSRKGMAVPEPVKEKTREYATGNEPVKERSRARPPPPPPLTTHPSMDRVRRAPERASSLSVDQGNEEVARPPARAMSLQPDLYSPNGRRVHPNLPNYDELTARLRALRNA